MGAFFRFLDPIIMFSVVCFPCTTGFMLFSLKKRGYNPVQDFIKSKWSINIDMKFFSSLRNNYKEATGNKFIPFLNVTTFYFGLIGVVILPIIQAFYEEW